MGAGPVLRGYHALHALQVGAEELQGVRASLRRLVAQLEHPDGGPVDLGGQVDNQLVVGPLSDHQGVVDLRRRQPWDPLDPSGVVYYRLRGSDLHRHPERPFIEDAVLERQGAPRGWPVKLVAGPGAGEVPALAQGLCELVWIVPGYRLLVPEEGFLVPVEHDPDRVERPVVLVVREYVADGGHRADVLDARGTDARYRAHHGSHRLLLCVAGVELDPEVGPVLGVCGTLVHKRPGMALDRGEGYDGQREEHDQ